MQNSTQELQEYYTELYTRDEFASEKMGDHSLSGQVERFVEQYKLADKKCLEVGCGRGVFQDLVEAYTGIDISATVEEYLHKPFHCCSADKLPFEDETFDAIWTVWTFEHIPDPEKSMREVLRVLKKGGILFFYPRWLCASWFADGYLVRPYSDFNLRGKLIKLSLVVRKRIWYKRCCLLAARTMKCIKHLVNPKASKKFSYKLLDANFEVFWQGDSDAINSIDVFDAISWFVANGHTCHGYDSPLSWVFARSSGIVIQKE